MVLNQRSCSLQENKCCIVTCWKWILLLDDPNNVAFRDLSLVDNCDLRS